MRGSKPAAFSGVGERAARSLDRVSRRRGPRRAAARWCESVSSLDGSAQRDLLDDVRRVREHSLGHDLGRVKFLTFGFTSMQLLVPYTHTPLCSQYRF